MVKKSKQNKLLYNKLILIFVTFLFVIAFIMSIVYYKKYHHLIEGYNSEEELFEYANNPAYSFYKKYLADKIELLGGYNYVEFISYENDLYLIINEVAGVDVITNNYTTKTYDFTFDLDATGFSSVYMKSLFEGYKLDINGFKDYKTCINNDDGYFIILTDNGNIKYLKYSDIMNGIIEIYSIEKLSNIETIYEKSSAHKFLGTYGIDSSGTEFRIDDYIN